MFSPFKSMQLWHRHRNGKRDEESACYLKAEPGLKRNGGWAGATRRPGYKLILARAGRERPMQNFYCENAVTS
jgi:hypothetical protein